MIGPGEPNRLFRLFRGSGPLRRCRWGAGPSIATVWRAAHDRRLAPSLHAREGSGHPSAIGAFGELAIGSHLPPNLVRQTFAPLCDAEGGGALGHQEARLRMSPARHLDCRRWGSGRSPFTTASKASGWSFGAALFPRRFRSGWPLRRDRWRRAGYAARSDPTCYLLTPASRMRAFRRCYPSRSP